MCRTAIFNYRQNNALKPTHFISGNATRALSHTNYTWRRHALTDRTGVKGIFPLIFYKNKNTVARFTLNTVCARLFRDHGALVGTLEICFGK